MGKPDRTCAPAHRGRAAAASFTRDDRSHGSRPSPRTGFALAALTSLALAGGLAGCSSLTPALQARIAAASAAPTDPSTSAQGAAPVVADLVGALVQLRDPRRTTVQIGPRDADPVFDALVAALADAGYGIQRVVADQGAHFLDWRYVAADDGRLSVRLALGALTLERSYRTGGAAVGGPLVASSPLAIAGTRRGVALDDAAHLPGTDPAHSRTVLAARDEPIGAVPIINLVTDDVVRGISAAATGGRRATSRQAINSGRVEVSNLFFGNGAFDALRGDLEPVSSEVIVFGNDSLRLGPDGKVQVARFVEGFRAGTDMIGLVGCSNGRTKLAIGNEGLALGRSARVVDELVALGVERTRILDEGCWAGSSAKGRFPSRGVVIELLRSGA